MFLLYKTLQRIRSILDEVRSKDLLTMLGMQFRQSPAKANNVCLV